MKRQRKILEQIAEDAAALDCEAEVLHARNILARGTSSHRQVGVYDRAIAAGKTHDQALREVVASVIEGTVRGI